MAAAEMTLTQFLRHSGPALEQVDTVDVRLQRRDGEDLYLKRADREEAEHESLAAAGRLLSRMLSDAAAAELMAAVLTDALPWARFLPDDSRTRFIEEFLQTIEAAASLDNFSPVGTLLKQWKNTADVWANPALRAVLEAEVEDGGLVVRPTAADG